MGSGWGVKKAVLKWRWLCACVLAMCCHGAWAVDTDGDGVDDSIDNCPLVANADQADFNSDGIGDACEDSDGDGLKDNVDPRPALPGDLYLDASFRGNGILNLAGNFALLVQQQDGKLLAASNNQLVRLNPDGNSDSTFNSGSPLSLPAAPEAMIQQTDGKILVALGTWPITVSRFNADGSADSSFANSGQLILSAGLVVNAILQQTNNKLLLIGSTAWTPGFMSSNFWAARFNSDGTPDYGFGNHGTVVTDFGGMQTCQISVALYTVGSIATRGLQLADGKLVLVGGFTDSMGGGGFAIARYNPDGSLDATFNHTGMVNTIADCAHYAWGGVTLGSANAVIQQHDGKLVVAGNEYYIDGSGGASFLQRFNVDGSLDTSFGYMGGLIYRYNNYSYGITEVANALLQQADDKLVVAGSSCTSISPCAAQGYIARFNSDGTADTSFGVSGAEKFAQTTPPDDPVQALWMQADGGLLLAGSSNGQMFIARMTIDSDGDGVADPIDPFPTDPAKAGSDIDGDTIPDNVDNCPTIFNPTQADFNADGIGDACEDSDHDGLDDEYELATSITNPLNADTDGDGVSDGFEIGKGYNPLVVDRHQLDYVGPGYTPAYAVQGDINNDGHDDVILAHGSAGNWVLEAFSDPVLANRLWIKTYNSISGKPAVIPDVNGDGYRDILVMNTSALCTISGKDGASLGCVALIAPGLSNADSLSLTGDLNGDGKPDVLLADLEAPFAGATGQLWIVSGADGTVLKQRALSGTGYSLLLAGDVNGDGMGEIVLCQDTVQAICYGLDGASLSDNWTYTFAEVSFGTFPNAQYPAYPTVVSYNGTKSALAWKDSSGDNVADVLLQFSIHSSYMDVNNPFNMIADDTTYRRVINLANGQMIDNTVPNELYRVTGDGMSTYGVDIQSYSLPVAVDFNNDGQQDILGIAVDAGSSSLIGKGCVFACSY